MRLAAHAAQLPSKAMGCGLFVLWMAAGILAAILFNTGGGGPLFGVLVLGLAAWVHWAMSKVVRGTQRTPIRQQPARAPVKRNQHVIVPCRVWAADRGGRIAARVTVYLPAIDALEPSNELPQEAFEVLPVGPAMQVTGEDQHMDVLGSRATGRERPVAVTLHAIHEVRPRSAFESVEVRLDGERVGVLSKIQSENMLPLVKHVEARGKTAVARAVIRGNKLKADVVLYVAKAQDVDPAWIDALGPVAPRSVEYTRRPEPEF